MTDNQSTIKLGVLGTGFGQTHARHFAAFPDVELVGIAGRDADKTARIAGELDTAPYTDAQALIGAVDAVSVCVPTHLHAQFVVQALHQGKHVFCETPFAFSLADAERMAQAAAETGKQLHVALFSRFVSAYKHVREMVQVGELGEVRTVYASRRTPPIWGGAWDENFILNLMLHDVDYVTWLLGVPRTVSCQGLGSQNNGWTYASIQLAYDNAAATVEGSGIMPESFPFTTGLRVVGTAGAVDVKWYWGGDMPVVEVEYYPEAGQPVCVPIEDYDPYQAACRHFSDCLHGKADPELLGIHTALNSLRVALAAKESLQKRGALIQL